MGTSGSATSCGRCDPSPPRRSARATPWRSPCCASRSSSSQSTTGRKPSKRPTGPASSASGAAAARLRRRSGGIGWRSAGSRWGSRTSSWTASPPRRSRAIGSCSGSRGATACRRPRLCTMSSTCCTSSAARSSMTGGCLCKLRPTLAPTRPQRSPSWRRTRAARRSTRRASFSPSWGSAASPRSFSERRGWSEALCMQRSSSRTCGS
mmetsp:Transcript_29438/g.67649  ORF Transcript_29438/g.67649 Transcript_29438/m.67649 type:complete len:208 (+) Transcript_29438:83-706(+)